MTPDAIRKLQRSLGLPTTGVFDAATSTAMSSAVATAVSKNKDVQRYAGANDPSAILTAYMSGNWSGVTDLTGKPFTDAQQASAVAEAEKALAPAYKAEMAYDTAAVTDALQGEQASFDQFQEDEKQVFQDTKTSLDQNAANEGVLFSGARVQKNKDLRNTYADREAQRRALGGSRIAKTARDFQYSYGDTAADGLSGMYTLPGQSRFDTNVASGGVTPNRSLSSVYNPRQYKFQGTKPVAQKAAVQTRAAGLLANKANKLSLSGVGAKF
jgi:hypothetical protein